MITPLYLVSKATKPPLRIAILIDGIRVPRYVATILDDIARSNFAVVELAIVLRADAVALARRLPGLAHELYVRVDHAVAGEGDPFSLAAPGGAHAGVDRLKVSSVGKHGEIVLPADAIAEIRRRDLDVILCFGSAVPRGEVLHAARYGVWSYHYGADEHPRGRTPFFQQVKERAPTVEVLLEVLEDEPGAGLLLCRSSFGSQRGLFLAPARYVAIWETTHFIVWKLHELHERGWEYVQGRALPRAKAADSAWHPHPPSAVEMTRFLVPRIVNAVENRLRGRHRLVGWWRIGLRRSQAPLSSAPEGAALAGFRWFDGPPGHYWADPFLVERGGKTFLFFEDYDDARSFASISVAEVQADGSLGPAASCLDTGSHLSFPFVFEHEGEMFMIPESVAGGTVTLYRARRFPDEWVEEKVLFHGNAVDTVLFREGGRFYFFTTLYEKNAAGMKTMLFLSDSLTGEWRLHPESPLSSDVRISRQAGEMFRHEGRLFRPTQNCGPHYGYGLNLQEVITLSEDQYEERPWRSFDPSRLLIPATGVHTYNRRGDLEVIDARYERQKDA